ncbi:leucine-rich repeat-containing protein 42 [Latimeria chalumnae]|uniref:leucine-rich repeat-containing protein 42 n=1 Tax=Latimeria chalumnae TaxID=7897 RepID=UPI00313C579D
MSSYRNTENPLELGPVYVREDGQLRLLNEPLDGAHTKMKRIKSRRLFQKGFSVKLINDGHQTTEKRDHFVFTYTKEGNLRYSVKPLFKIALGFVAENVQHIDSLVDFPEQIAEELFTAAEARQKFIDPNTGLAALQTFTKAYGSLVLQSLCLRSRYLLISEKLEEIKAFQGLTHLDLSCCKLGDDHEILEHLSSKALSSLTHLYLKDNCLSDNGLRKMTSPVRIMKKGLENLKLLDLSCNPKISDFGIMFLSCFNKLRALDVSGTCIQNSISAVKIQTQLGLVLAEESLKEFSHADCKTEGWAEQVVLQWENTVSKAIKPRENLKARTQAQHFYGKEKPAEALLPDRPRMLNGEEKEPVTLQFHRKQAEGSFVPVMTEEKGTVCRGTRLNKNRKKTFDSINEEKDYTLLSAKHHCTEFTVEDWDLLNKY